MAKFIIGVVFGIFLGASAAAYGAGNLGPDTLSGWIISQHRIGATAQTHLN